MTMDALFEIGLEELPARFVDDAEKQLLAKTEDWLQDLRVAYFSITSFSTPRRLAVLIKGMAEEQTTIEEEAKGPAIKIAKDNDGIWTKAAIGFSKGQGKTTDDIYTKEVNGTEYIFVKKHIEGKKTAELLPAFKEIILSLQFAKNMRWGEETLRFARPIRWLVALLDKEIIPFEIAHVKTGNQTEGHRFLGDTITLEKPSDYLSALEANFVIAETNKRKQMIVDGIHELETKEGLSIPMDSDLLNEVNNLVEYPTVFIGTFDEAFLEVPSEALISSMKEHQRYFPVKSKNGRLLAHFVGVRNGNSDHLETVVKGNEKVLRARLADAQFFYEEDQKHPIEFYLQKLTKVVFQEKLGTIHDKVERVAEITKQIADKLMISDESKKKAIRAAELSKFDLMTNMVNEFTELQGIMGEKYAIIYGEDPVVAKAIAEHYLPRHANGELPETVEGAIVSIADKLDTIVGCISVGLVPTGSTDPYGLRRQAVGMLKILKENGWNIAVDDLVAIAQRLYETTDIDLNDHEQVTPELYNFLKLRSTYLLKEAGIEIDIIQAVLSSEIGVIGYTIEKARLLSAKRNDNSFKQTQEAFTRTLNLAKKSQGSNVDQTLFETESEKGLFDNLKEVITAYQTAKTKLNADEALNNLSKLTTPIHDFFEHNMVMANDENVRLNRLALLNEIAILVYDFGDITKVEWKQHF